jgi:hypothetical protein
VRTLIVSDLHLGQRPGQDVLRVGAVRQRLLGALDTVDRLVLLGDIVELGSRLHRRRPMEVAGPVLAEIAARMGPEREIVLVPGNHDGILTRDWARARGDALGLADAVPTDVTPLLASVTAMLAPARVRVSYPGLWVREDVWATHGHYLDRHLVPESTYGLRRRGLAQPAAGAVPGDYESRRTHGHRCANARSPPRWIISPSSPATAATCCAAPISTGSPRARWTCRPAAPQSRRSPTWWAGSGLTRHG